MKRFTKIAAVIAAAGVTATLAGCMNMDGCSGCGGSKVTNSALTNSNWYTQTGYKGIQPYFIDGNGNFQAETLVYDVTFKPSVNGTYRVEYSDGTYTTNFYAAEWNWNSESIPEKYRSERTETLYWYETDFEISGKYIMGGEEKEFTDSVKTVSVFRSAYYSLKPVYSKQEIKSTSPAAYRPASLKDAYKEYDVVYENYYNYKRTEVTYTKTEGEKTETKTRKKLNKTSNTLFDNSSLYTVIRSLKLSSSLSQSIDLFSAAQGGVSTVKLAGSGTKLDKDELKKVSEALAEKDLYTPVTKDKDGNDIEDKGVSTVAVSIAYDGGDMSGTTQTVWYAALKDADNNTARCTMLKLSVPLSFSLGTLNFTLKEVQSTLWNN